MSERCCPVTCNFSPERVARAVAFVYACWATHLDPVLIAYRALKPKDDLPVLSGRDRTFESGDADCDSDEVILTSYVVHALKHGFDRKDVEGISRSACPWAMPAVEDAA